MVSETTKELLWQGLVDATHLSRYYAYLTKRHMSRQRWTRGGLLVSAILGFSGLFEAVPIGVSVVGNVAVVIVVVIDFMHDYGPKAATLNATSIVCAKVEDQRHALWADVVEDRIEEDKAREINSQLERLISEAAVAPSYLSVELDDDLNQISYEESTEMLRSRYAISEA